jgi:hypothetical protein
MPHPPPPPPCLPGPLPLQLRLSAPLPTPSRLSSSGGFGYLLTYLDEEVLVGRAQGSGGVFVFTRDAPASAAAPAGLGDVW